MASRDLGRAKPFYRAIMAALGAVVGYDRDDAIGFGERNRPDGDGHTYVSILRSADAGVGFRRHWCFRAGSAAEVRAFLRDPEGNRIEAVCHRGDP